MKGLNGITPQEAWNGRKSSASHLKVFRTIAYAYVNDQVRTKLHDKNKKMIFACYDQRFKGYKLYNPNEGKTMINRDVEFDREGA